MNRKLYDRIRVAKVTPYPAVTIPKVVSPIDIFRRAASLKLRSKMKALIPSREMKL
jgi:hypothetical protein